MNKTWHAQHVLGKKATIEQRIAWHKEHAKVCGCRPIPESIRRLIEQKS